jgi:hypothetical protein
LNNGHAKRAGNESGAQNGASTNLIQGMSVQKRLATEHTEHRACQQPVKLERLNRKSRPRTAMVTIFAIAGDEGDVLQALITFAHV